MNVCIYPPLHGGGLQEHFTQTLRVLPAQGVEFRIAPDTSRDCQIAHLFSLPDVYSSLEHFLEARRAGWRIVRYSNKLDSQRYASPRVAPLKNVQAMNKHRAG